MTEFVLFDKVEAKYEKLLAWALTHRKTVVITVTLVLIGSFALIPFIGMEFIPKTDSGELALTVELDKGTVLEETDKVARDIESRLSDIPEIETVFVNVGGASMMGTSSSEVAQMQCDVGG
ncbi:MAG: efflux RND transporter permease subunit [Bacillota bacterium]